MALQEELKTIPGFSNYKATRSGKIWSCFWNKFIIQRKAKNPPRNYLDVFVYNDSGKRKQIRVHIHKLTTESVIKIKQLVKNMSQKKVGEIFGIDQSHVSDIINGYRWSHIN